VIVKYQWTIPVPFYSAIDGVYKYFVQCNIQTVNKISGLCNVLYRILRNILYILQMLYFMHL